MAFDIAKIREETLNAKSVDAIRSLHTVILKELERVTSYTKRNMEMVAELNDVLHRRLAEIEDPKSLCSEKSHEGGAKPRTTSPEKCGVQEDQVGQDPKSLRSDMSQDGGAKPRTTSPEKCGVQEDRKLCDSGLDEELKNWILVVKELLERFLG
uniref:Uncharacterized protein n=1 Tax=Steinernema glaseri TaxID=37863 RepID=A0A1I8ACT3_9BILA